MICCITLLEKSVAYLSDSNITVLSFPEDTYERTLMVDGEIATIILLDMWENKVCRACDSVNSGACLPTGCLVKG